MAKKKTAKKPAKKTNRGSPEAIAKRKIARALNRMFNEAGTEQSLDGRTLKRKRRLTLELKEGRNGKPLKALEVLGHATELMTMGETLTTLRKLKPKLPATPALGENAVEIMAETQKLYGFDPAAWKLLGVQIDKLGEAPAPAKAAKPAPTKKRARSRRAR